MFPSGTAGTACDYDYGTCSNDKHGFLDEKGTCLPKTECIEEKKTGKYVYPYYSIDAAVDKTNTYSDASDWTFYKPPPRGVSRRKVAFEDVQYCYPSDDDTRGTMCVRCRDESDPNLMHIRHNPAKDGEKESFTCTPFKDGDVCYEPGPNTWGLYDATKKECDTSALKDGAECFVTDKDSGKRVQGELMDNASDATYDKVPCIPDDSWAWWVWVLIVVAVLLVVLATVGGVAWMVKKK